jgi:hypothetical protein
MALLNEPVDQSQFSENIIERVFLPTPLPAAMSLFGTALAGLGGAGWIKRWRKASA